MLRTENSHKVVRFISTLFVPPSFTLIVFTLFAFAFEHKPHLIAAGISIPLIFGFLAPISLFLILRKQGKLVDQDASVKEERNLPYFIALIFYVAGFLLMLKYDINLISIAFWFCYISNTLITIVINRFWKISAHAMGAAGAFAAVGFAFGLSGLILLPIVFIVGWSRIKLKCHNFAQVAAGIILAALSVYLQMFFITKYF